jgi:hypothetical protein
MSIIGFIFFGLAIALFLIGILRTKSNEATPSFSFLFGLKNNIWRLYRLQQTKVEIAGRKVLPKSKSDEILNEIRHDLKKTPKIIHQPLTEEETSRIIERNSKRLGIKQGQVSQRAVSEIVIIGNAIDKCEAGVSSVIAGNNEYKSINERINNDRIYLKKDRQIKELKRLSYSLNTIYLTILYYKPTVQKIAPSLKVPNELMKEVLDEEMQRQLEML